jgi:enoyl-[acyl-carrier protein] reductase/trans-2-enoyl-CoA reductase (NAD+)
MVVKPRVREYMCLTAHPQGCKENVKRQIEYVKSQGMIKEGPKKVLVIGASTGYGLASRIEAAFGCGADTLGIMFERPSNGRKTATAGWYNTAAFETFAAEAGYYAKSLNGDAFSQEMKEKAIEMIKKDLGKVDMVIYSLAAPRRTMADGTTYSSVLKTTGETFTNKSLDLRTNKLNEKTVETATKEEVEATVKVMGGEDWRDWIHALSDADAIAQDAVTVAYSYIGPELTYPIYYGGTIGQAKQHLYKTAYVITEEMKEKGIKGYVSVNKALVTQSSAAIPIVPLYISIMYKVMKEMGNHEGCIEQICRMFKDRLLVDQTITDENGLIRVDDYELSKEVQDKIKENWNAVNQDNLEEIADIDGYWEDFYQMFGFRMPGVDYEEDLDVVIPIPSITE